MDLKKNKNIEAKKIGFFDKLMLRAMMPNLKKYTRKYSETLKDEDKFVVVSREEFELTQKMLNRQESYLTQIKLNNTELEEFKNINNGMIRLMETVLKKLEQKEYARRKTAGKVGGLTASLNKEKEKTDQLIKNKASLENTIENLKDEVETKELELKEKELKIEIYKNLGKKRQMEDYKKIQEIRKDIDKHKRIRGVNYEQSEL